MPHSFEEEEDSTTHAISLYVLSRDLGLVAVGVKEVEIDWQKYTQLMRTADLIEDPLKIQSVVGFMVDASYDTSIAQTTVDHLARRNRFSFVGLMGMVRSLPGIVEELLVDTPDFMTRPEKKKPYQVVDWAQDLYDSTINN
jgi:hypothetical protein